MDAIVETQRLLEVRRIQQERLRIQQERLRVEQEKPLMATDSMTSMLQMMPLSLL